MTIPSRTGGDLPRIGVALRDPLPWAELVQVVRTAEETGHHALFVPEITGREAFGTLAALSRVTERLILGTGVVTMWSRSPVTAAMAAATVQDLSGGRFVLGVGAGTTALRGMHGDPSGRPMQLIEEYVRLVRSVLSGEQVHAHGPFPVDGFRLTLPLEGGPPPVWVGALGDRMLALAGRLADGVIMNWCTPERVARGRRIIRESAVEAGRDPGRVTLSVYVRACLGAGDSVALAALREMTAQYAAIPHYLRQMEAMGLGEEGRRAAKAHGDGRPQDVPEPLVRALAVAGGRDEALARFAAYQEAGADLVLCYPVAVRDHLSSILGTVLASAPSTATER